MDEVNLLEADNKLVITVMPGLTHHLEQAEQARKPNLTWGVWYVRNQIVKYPTAL